MQRLLEQRQLYGVVLTSEKLAAKASLARLPLLRMRLSPSLEPPTFWVKASGLDHSTKTACTDRNMSSFIHRNYTVISGCHYTGCVTVLGPITIICVVACCR